MTTKNLPGFKYLLRLAEWSVNNKYFDFNDNNSVAAYQIGYQVIEGRNVSDHSIHLLIAYSPPDELVKIDKELVSEVKRKVENKVNTPYIEMVNALNKVIKNTNMQYITDLMLFGKSEIKRTSHVMNVVKHGMKKVVYNVIYDLMMYDRDNVIRLLEQHFGIRGSEVLESCERFEKVLKLCGEHAQIIFDYFCERPEAPEVPTI